MLDGVPVEIEGNMGKRADVLAERIEQGAESLATFAEGLSDAEWQTGGLNDQRPVSVVVHHVASVYPIEVDLARKLALGEPITGVTWDAINQMNAQHAQEHPTMSKQETLQLLRDNSKAAADRVREFTDEDLDNAAVVSLNAGAPLTAQFFIEAHALSHSFHHLAAIQAALNR
jgi:hypothetical protein